MHPQTSRPSQAKWSSLRPRYKLLVSAPCFVGLATLFLVIFPGAWLLATLLGISWGEPVIQHRYGSLFMLVLCAAMPIAALSGMTLARRILTWWLVRYYRYSDEQIELALAWRAYPEAWFAAAHNR
jgi:hypothetical protein